eukprot:tig00021326_g20279.t1
MDMANDTEAGKNACRGTGGKSINWKAGQSGDTPVCYNVQVDADMQMAEEEISAFEDEEAAELEITTDAQLEALEAETIAL